MTWPPPYSKGSVSDISVAPMYRSTAAPGWVTGTSFIHALPIFMGGSEWPRLMMAPEEHMAPKVPVVTTSTSLKATLTPLLSASSFISSTVRTRTSPRLIFSLISGMERSSPLFEDVVLSYFPS